MDENYKDPELNAEPLGEDDDDADFVDLITLADEDGVEHEFELADSLDIEDQHYVALIPTDQSPEEMLAEDGELVIMKQGTDDNGEEFFSLIEDDDEFYKVSDIFTQRLSELYDFESDDGEKE